ncbi:trypsin-like [Epargyreus clarus]|uniref:trypsin-like n=1 Tax=Epargyreus clarus TaxID=520877 RepID=UPI003C2B6116
MENDTLHINKVTVNNSTSKECTDRENSISKEVNQTVSKKNHVNYPFSVSIQKKSSHYTSGALVDKHWVLTSASEFFNVRETIKLFRARVGSVNCKRGGVLIPIKMVEIHPSYAQNKPAYDVALLRLAMPVIYNEFVAPITISNVGGKVVSAKFLATYWPRLIVRGQVLPQSAKERVKQNSMRVSTQKLIPWDTCRSIMELNNVTLEHSSLCLEPIISHHTPCMPDPGAPVLAKDGLWGITSGWTPKSCLVSSATVFTRLSSPLVRSWLQLFLVDY